MKRQLIVVVVLLLGLGSNHAAGAQQLRAPNAAKDPLAWIGPLPKTISTASLDKRWDRLIKQVFAEISTTDVRRFACKSPAEVGPTPMMNAVEAYIDGAPDSLFDDVIMHDLNEAAAKGNWLARTLIFFWLNAYDEKQYQYRAVVLAEWMHERRLGQLYAAFGDMLMASGYYSDAPSSKLSAFDTMAAMHHSYVAQNDVGKALSASDDPELAAVGRKMLACASGSLGAYRRLFNKEGTQARD
jgi:hypothetical protein